jgi:hypothetical protein
MDVVPNTQKLQANDYLPMIALSLGFNRAEKP